MSLVRAYEEVQYARPASILVARLIDPLVTPDMIDVLEVTLSKVRLKRPFDRLWFCTNHSFWAKDRDFEIRLRSRSMGELIFAGWHNLEVHAILAW